MIHLHIIAFFGIVLLISLRTFGFIIALEFLHERKQSKYKAIIFGWFFWILSGFFALFSGISEDQLFSNIFQLINGITTSIALLFVLRDLFSYFWGFPEIIQVLLSVIFITIPLISFLLGFYYIAFNLSSMFIFLIIVVYSIVPLMENKTFKNNSSIKSYYWYLVVILAFYLMTISDLIFALLGYSFSFYSEVFSISMFSNLFLGNITTIVTIIYFIHIRYDISNIQKYKLRDKYSHDLGNIIQVIYSAAMLTNVDEDLDKEKAETLKIIQEKCDEAIKLIKDIKINS